MTRELQFGLDDPETTWPPDKKKLRVPGLMRQLTNDSCIVTESIRVDVNLVARISISADANSLDVNYRDASFGLFARFLV